MDREHPTDDLSVALTRPTLWFGIPYYAAIFGLMVSVVAWVWMNAVGVPFVTTTLIIAAFDLVLWFIAWDLTRGDPYFFNVAGVFFSVVNPQPTSRKTWGGRTYETR